MSRLIVLLSLAAPALPAVDFTRDIKPILSDRCFACHGPDSGNRKSKLRLDLEDAAKADLGNGRFGLVAGSPDRSLVFQRVTSNNKGLRMPPAYAGHDALTAAQVDLLKQWIASGASYQRHWSLVPPRRDPQSSIDSLVRARLAREGLSLSPAADPAALLRRVTLDLTGLPPSPAELDAFLRNPSLAAYEQHIDRLLASPRYAERMAIRWLEAARYADTNGYQTDGPRDMWRWRDWVIDSFHRNQPFDQFTREQIAGDLLPNATLAQKIATGFQRNHRTTAEGGIVDEEFRVEYVADRAETTATVFLGLTLGCSRCHDHKYDPITQRDYYSMFAFYNNQAWEDGSPEKGFVFNFGNEAPTVKAPTADQAARLATLDAALHQARRAWDHAQPRLTQQQRDWEQSLSPTLIRDWTPADGRLINERSVNPGLDLGKEIAKFNYRDPLTLSARIKPAAPDGAVITRYDDYFEGTGYGLFLTAGKLRFHFVFRWTDLGMRLEAKQPVRLNTWQQVTVTYDGLMRAKGVHLYIDGVEQELNVLFDQHIWPVDNKVPLKIGAGAGLGYQGEIADVLVYSRALSRDEVLAISVPDSPAKRRFAFLDLHAIPERNALRAAERERDRYHATLPTVMVLNEGPKRQAYILKRGAYDAPGDPVNPAVPASLGGWKPEYPANRLGLAQWLTSAENPLTARVTVNRFWQMLFGSGLVKTVEDFGSQGEIPPHQELLDWLAVEFVESGWNVKRLWKTILLSDTYRQSGHASPELLQRDPENRLLARGPRRRLSPEMIRDQALAVSGLLVERIGGPSVKPYQPAGLWNELHGGKEYEPDTGEGLYRRSLYTYWKRTVAPPSMMNFDSPTRETCVVRETRTNTPLQALNLMNDVTYVEAGRKFAERMLRENPSDPIGYGFRLLLARTPTTQERDILSRTLAHFEQRFRANPAAANQLLQQGASPADRSLPDLAAYASLANLMLNLDETVTKP